ncbi:MAG: AgmX/PglI C-terminal domain-containing protein [Proteobacteria bacterium]|nr:AgmX/PglI C-terminal domain-containing protein [Pseudomonadota bacterium]
MALGTIREQAIAQAQSVGVLGLIGGTRGGPLAAIFALDTALGPEATAAWGSLSGEDPGEAYGVNGLGARGTGRHGGGDAVGIGVGPLGTVGARGRGGEPGDYGGGVAHLASHTASTPRAQTGAIAIRGGLDKELVRRAIRQHLNAIRYCYSRALLTNHQLEGRVSVEFAIAADGKVATAKILTSTLADTAAEQCITAAIRRIVFPKPPQGDLVIVSYPFVLRAPGS